MKQGVYLFLCLLLTVNISAQVGINTDNSDPDASAMLDIKSPNKGVLIPRMSSTDRQQILEPAVGLMVYDFTAQAFYYFNGVGWLELLSGSVAVLSDEDNDTKVDVTEIGDEDRISFTVGGTERLLMQNNLFRINGRLNINNAFSFPIVDGTSDQVLTTNGTGTLSWTSLTDNDNQTLGLNMNTLNLTNGGSVDLSSYLDNTDDQKIDVLNLNGTNLEISLTDDGETTKTLDLSGIDTDTDTDDQKIDVLNLNGTNLEISLTDDGEATKTLDLSSLNTATDTDDQKIDVLNLNGTNLEISLTDDGEATKTLDLSGIDTDDQKIDVLNLNGTNLEISLTDDGEATKTLDLSGIDTDDQKIDVLNLNGTNLEISLTDDGEATKTLDLSSLNTATDTDDQKIDVLNLNGTNLEISLTDDGETTKTLDLSSLKTTDTLAIIADADNDTKIQVEESPDSDTIKFDIGGIEAFRFLGKGRIELENSAGNLFIGKNAGANDDNDTTNSGKNNIALGDDALSSNVTGQANIALGVFSLKDNTGHANVSIGYASSYENTVGRNNVAIGYGSSYQNTTGSNNVAIGSGSFLYNTDGDNNVAIGNRAGWASIGEQSVYVGYNSGGGDPSKSNNVMLGAATGFSNEGAGSVFIGHRAGFYEVDSNRLYIANSDANATNALIYGEFDNALLRINGELNINNAFSFPTADGSIGQVLQTDGSGSLAWSTLTTTLIQDTDSDTKIQVEEGADEDIIRFDVAGSEFMKLDGNRIELISPSKSTAIGEDAGVSTSPNDYNSFYGFEAGKNNTYGAENTFLGVKAGRNVQYGTQNTAIGTFAGQNLQSGYSNVYVGTLSGHANSNGNENTFIGMNSGAGSSGSRNVFLGNQVGQMAGSVSNRLYIDNSSTSSPLLYGEFDNNLLRVNGTLNINNAFSFPTADGSIGQVLQTDGSGNITWTSVSGINTLNNLSDADNDTKIQVEASADEDVIRFDLGGTEYLRLTNGKLEFDNTDNIYIGTDIDTINSNGTDNTIIGRNSLNTNTSGSDNVAVGIANLSSNTSGFQNTTLGTLNLYENQTGVYNTAIGAKNLYKNNSQYNTAVGAFNLGETTTGYLNTTLGTFNFQNNNGNYNIGIGSYTGNKSLNGNNNILIGHQAGAGNTNHSKSNSVMIGYQAGSNNQGDANVFLGAQAGQNETGSNKLYIENTNADATNALIYGEFDNDLLRINGELNINNAFSFPTADGTIGQVLQTGGNGSLAWSTLTDNDNQALSLATNTLSLVNGGSVDLSSYVNTDAQALSLATNTLSLTNGGSVDLSAYANENTTLIQDADNDTKIQVEESADEDIIRFDIAGSERLRIENDGTLNINNAFSLPTTDGTNGEVLQTDGSGNLAWSDVSKISKDNGWSATANTSSLSIKSSLFFERFNFSNSGLTIKAESNGVFGDAQILKFESGSNINQISNHFPAISGVATPPTDSDYQMRFSVKGNEILELAATGEVTINENYTLPNSDGSADEVLVTDGNGNTSWKNVGVPIGTIQMWATATAPTGWMICDGSTFTSIDYPDLAAVLGTTTLPNFNGRMPLGVGQSNENGAITHTLNQTGGEETHTLTNSEMPEHDHEVTVTYREGVEGGNGSNYSDLGGGTSDSKDFTSTKAGDGDAHNNMPPFLTINFIIKAK